MLKTIKRILNMAGKSRGKLYLSFIAGFMENAMMSVSMFCIYLSLLWLLTNAFTTQKLIGITVALVSSVILRFGFKLTEYILQSGTGYEIVCNARINLGKKLNRLSMGFFSSTDAGDISSVVNNDLVFVEGYAMSFLSKVIGALASAALMTAGLFWIDWRIALCSCIAYPVTWLVNRHMQKIIKKCAPERQEAHAETSGIMLEYLHGRQTGGSAEEKPFPFRTKIVRF
jgi:ATP-binding cassette subfamily B protein